MEMKKKVASSRALYVSHIEAVQNVVRFHKASSNAGLDEISSLASANAHSIEEVGSNLSFVTCLLLHFFSFAVFSCFVFLQFQLYLYY